MKRCMLSCFVFSCGLLAQLPQTPLPPGCYYAPEPGWQPVPGVLRPPAPMQCDPELIPRQVRKGRPLSGIVSVEQLRGGPAMKQMLRAIKAMERGDLQAASAEAEAAMQQNPRWPEGYVSLGGIYLAGGALEPARKAFLRALDLHKYSAAALAGLGTAEFALGHVAESREHVKRALALDPTLSMVRDAAQVIGVEE